MDHDLRAGGCVTRDDRPGGPMSAAIVGAVIVMFNPERNPLIESVRAWAEQAATVICIDNGGSAPLRGELEALGPGRVQFVPMEGNAGLGAAHNRGIALARLLGCSHVVLGDQDSLPGPGMIAGLVRVEALALASGQSVAVVGPRLIDADSGRSAHFVRFGPISLRRIHCPNPDGWVFADLLISSGSLIRMQVLDLVGQMDERLFIDMVDTDWCLRARRAGLVAIGAYGARMIHHLGDETLVIRLGRTRTLPVHKPFRYYYMFRNSLLLYRRPYADWRWIVPDMVRLMQIGLFFGIFHRARVANLSMMLRGIADGMRGVTGPTPR
jgi:rhamnosyltransferase